MVRIRISKVKYRMDRFALSSKGTSLPPSEWRPIRNVGPGRRLDGFLGNDHVGEPISIEIARDRPHPVAR